MLLKHALVKVGAHGFSSMRGCGRFGADSVCTELKGTGEIYLGTEEQIQQRISPLHFFISPSPFPRPTLVPRYPPLPTSLPIDTLPRLSAASQPYTFSPFFRFPDFLATCFCKKSTHKSHIQPSLQNPCYHSCLPCRVRSRPSSCCDTLGSIVKSTASRAQHTQHIIT